METMQIIIIILSCMVVVFSALQFDCIVYLSNCVRQAVLAFLLDAQLQANRRAQSTADGTSRRSIQVCSDEDERKSP